MKDIEISILGLGIMFLSLSWLVESEIVADLFRVATSVIGGVLIGRSFNSD